jgi:hypothetical protein
MGLRGLRTGRWAGHCPSTEGRRPGPDTPKAPLPLLPSGPGGVHGLRSSGPAIIRARRRAGAAEREGFEPSVPFWGTYDFQSYTFGLSVTSPGAGPTRAIGAERVGFEPTVSCPTLDFESSAFGRSATSPELMGDALQGRPLRCRKNLRSCSVQASAHTPPSTTRRWLRRASTGIAYRLVTAPALGSVHP